MIDKHHLDPVTVTFYAFERAARKAFEPANPQDLTIDACIELADAAFHHLQCAAPWPVAVRPRLFDGVEAAFCTLVETQVEGDAFFLIGLPPGRRRPWVVLHEVAHTLHWEDGHGPHFAWTCIQLWIHVGGWDGTALMTLAREYRIDGPEHLSRQDVRRLTDSTGLIL